MRRKRKKMGLKQETWKHVMAGVGSYAAVAKDASYSMSGISMMVAEASNE